MSGICGLFNLDGRPVTDAGLRPMTALLERRGPERTALWRDGCTGLGHALLATTPEAQLEHQPLVHAESGCVITADARLDNRDELVNALGFAPRNVSPGDAELILAAYLQWGERCPEQLLGDFAFAVWDARQQVLFAARDHFGLRPLCYHHVPRERFAFASEPKAILVLPEVPYAINDGRIADFLVPELEWIDYTSTFFEGVCRLPPGHRAIVTPGGLKVEEYWNPAPGPAPGPLSDEAFAEGFLEVFTKAVEARLRAPPASVGAMLSGGVDSGSVVVTAKEVLAARGNGPLHTYSAARRQAAHCAESKAIVAATAMAGIDPALVHPDELADDIEALVSGNEEPFDGEMTILKAIYRAAHRDGRKVVLDGGGGDIVMNEGSYVVRLLRAGHVARALHEISGERQFWGEAMPRFAALRYWRAAFVPGFAKRHLRGLQGRIRNRTFIEQSLISRDLLQRVDINGRFERMRRTFPGSVAEDYAIERCNAIRPNVTAGRERYARLAAAAGIEARDPFLDKRVVEYCARLPGHLLMKDGWPKRMLRDAMARRLPDEVRWCRGKPHLGQLFNSTVDHEAVDRGAMSLTGLEERLAGYVDPVALQRAWQAFIDGGDSEPIHSALMLSAWLRENAMRPVVPGRQFG